MATKRTALTMTLTVDEWHHVLAVLKHGSKHLEPAAEAVALMFEDSFRRQLVEGLSARDLLELADDLGESDVPPQAA